MNDRHGARVALAAVVALLAIAPSARAEPVPTVPIVTAFGYWDHHWFAWLPQHPTYEAVEVAAVEHPRRVVWVWFTERAGGKDQDQYLTDAQMARSRGPRAYHRDIDYRSIGTAGAPLGLQVTFKDKDDKPVVLELDASANTGLGSRGAGFTPSAGHAAATIFHLFYRDKAALLFGPSRLLIDGARVTMAVPAYSSGIYPIVLPYGRTRFDVTAAGLTDSRGRTFTRVTVDGASTTYRAGDPASPTTIELDVDERGATRRYTHRDRAHAVDIRFSPALPPLGAMRDGQQIRYEFWLEDRQKLMDGVIDVAVTASGDAVLHWRHDLPPSMGRVPFRSVIRTRPEGGGYEIDVQPETGGATPP